MEPEGVNAGPPVDGGRPPAPPDEDQMAVRHDPARDTPAAEPEGQGSGEMLSRPGSDNGLTQRGPGQEMSAGEG